MRVVRGSLPSPPTIIMMGRHSILDCSADMNIDQLSVEEPEICRNGGAWKFKKHWIWEEVVEEVRPR